jgi:hypothetical protein
MTRNGSSLVPPPPTPGVEALLACERTIVERTDAVRDRVLSRAQESLWKGDLVVESLGVPVWAKVLLSTAGTFAAVATVATVLHLTKHKEPRKQTPGAAYIALAEQPPAPMEVAPPAGLPPSVQAAPASEAKAPASPSHKVADAFEELRLLDRARQSDVRGDYVSVLAIANNHARNYPDGRLVEEREVLRLKALVSLGRSRDARHAAGDFRRQFPRSVLLPTVEAMLASLH